MNERPRQPQVLHDIWESIFGDSWMWVVDWGKNRKGKSTLAMQLGYRVYHDWDDVLQCIVWNLADLRYKMNQGVPRRILTRNGLHHRVPYLILDDFGATCNKAKTQHEPAWDIFKGAFDTYSTKVAVIVGTMLIASEPTHQIHTKFTHELWVDRRGHCKYDEVDWQQDYAGWQPRQKKDWWDSFTFDPLPDDVYKQYDQMRCSIADELDQQVDDAMADTLIPGLLKRLEPDDVQLMTILKQQGATTYDYFHDNREDKFHDAIVRCKSRSLVISVRRNNNYRYDLTDLGLETLQAWEQAEKEKIPKIPTD